MARRHQQVVRWGGRDFRLDRVFQECNSRTRHAAGLTISGAISGAGSLTKSGRPDTDVLSGTNTTAAARRSAAARCRSQRMPTSERPRQSARPAHRLKRRHAPGLRRLYFHQQSRHHFGPAHRQRQRHHPVTGGNTLTYGGIVANNGSGIGGLTVMPARSSLTDPTLQRRHDDYQRRHAVGLERRQPWSHPGIATPGNIVLNGGSSRACGQLYAQPQSRHRCWGQLRQRTIIAGDTAQLWRHHRQQRRRHWHTGRVRRRRHARTTGSNTYSLGTTIYDGAALSLGSGNALGPGPVTVYDGGTLNINSQSETVAGLTLADGFVDGPGVLTSTSTYQVQSGSIAQ